MAKVQVEQKVNRLKDLILGHDDNDDDSDNYDITMMSTVMIKTMFTKQ